LAQRRKAARPESPTADRILDAAEALFAEHGLSGVSVRDIAARVGLTPASLYNHFPGKLALYDAVLERGVRPLVSILKETSEEPAGPEATDRLIEALMAHMGGAPHLARLIQHEAVSGGEHLARLARRFVRPLVAQGLAELKRGRGLSAWSEEEHPLLIAAWVHLIVGHFAMAPLLAEVFDEDPLSPKGCARQTRFLRKLARLLMNGGGDSRGERAHATG